jgi:sulfoacetaldehyde dehydrogenase
VKAENLQAPQMTEAQQAVAEMVSRARAAQRAIGQFSQEQIDDIVSAAGWAILEPNRNKELAELAVKDTGLGVVEDKIRKNHNKTLGLLRDLKGRKTVGVIHQDLSKGITEIARPVGVVAAITPSTNPGATPANKVINALKAGNAVILAPSPKGVSTCARFVEFVHEQLGLIQAPTDLVQFLPAPITKEATQALMQQADLVVATGSQANIRAAYTCGTPAFGVGAGNVVSVVDETAKLAEAAEKIAASKTFDNATSCSSENSLVLFNTVYEQGLAELSKCGGVLLSSEEKAKLEAVMFSQGKLSGKATAQSAGKIASMAGLSRPEVLGARFLMVEEEGTGPQYPFSGEKLAPVLAVFKANDFEHACRLVSAIYSYQGAGHSVSMHSTNDERILSMGLHLPVCRVIVNQAHCFATGGSFSNGLPFSLSMGCGTWGGNNFSENMNVSQYMNITRIAKPIVEVIPSVESLLGDYLKKVSV